MSIVTTKGQATIPKKVRDYLGIVPGQTEVEFVRVGERIELVAKTVSNRFAAVRGITKNKLSTDEIMDMTRG